MNKIVKFVFIAILPFCFIACGSDDEPDGPDINNANTSLDGTFAKLNGKYTATWSETLDDVTYNMTFTPYTSPKNQDITVSNGSSVNFTKKVRIFGRVNVVRSYTFSNGATQENSNKNYLYGIETTVGEPYEIVFYPYSSVDNDDMIYGLSTSYKIKDISNQTFNLMIDGEFHLFEK